MLQGQALKNQNTHELGTFRSRSAPLVIDPFHTAAPSPSGLARCSHPKPQRSLLDLLKHQRRFPESLQLLQRCKRSNVWWWVTDFLTDLLRPCIRFDRIVASGLFVAVVAERLRMLCGNTYTPRRPLEAG
ncbi:hypothetical protein D9C73_024404 [Collichthys lucidus]|uniref:Uncharacterized protein n=1 Tax=Collichthys lucidus TaxID=240159 RepID=A0A4U5VP32_COLLU|nr:hypothetical protein D9C73_024404 [Collichthys lucidus]